MSLNLMLFLLPFFSGLLAVYSLGDSLGIYNHESPQSLAYTLAYFAISSGSANIFIGKLASG
jgi:ABC-type Na+ efflux pump permease subunit